MKKYWIDFGALDLYTGLQLSLSFSFILCAVELIVVLETAVQTKR